VILFTFGRMAYYLVTHGHGPAWDPARPRREQHGWDEHAAFMDGLTERGTVLLGGPIGDDVDRGEAVVVVCADDEAATRAVLAADPWHENVLTIATVQRWSLWLRSPTLPPSWDEAD
jgi:uncharacterized protein YciI